MTPGPTLSHRCVVIHEDDVAMTHGANTAFADIMIETPWHRLNDAKNAYHEIFRNIPDGLTYLACHFNAPGDFETVEPEYAHIRTDEYALFRTPQIAEWLREYGLETVGFREIRDSLRTSRADRGT